MAFLVKINAIVLVLIAFFIAVNFADKCDVKCTGTQRAPGLIKAQGYNVEEHPIVTLDGHKIILHRVLRNSRKDTGKVIFMQHGIGGSSEDWLLLNPPQSLCYQLVDLGFDVWLGNVRGTTYGKKHVVYNINTFQFWNFTWHEMGIYDTPTAIDYILAITNQEKLSFIGHSLGTTIFFVMASEMPEYNAKIDKMIGLAPLGYVAHSTSDIKYLIPFADPITYSLFGAKIFAIELPGIVTSKGFKSFISSTQVPSLFKDLGLTEHHTFSDVDENVLPRVLAQGIKAIPIKSLRHYGQEFISKKFCRYDEASMRDVILEKWPNPPEYPIENISIPLHLYWGDGDTLATKPDIDMLVQRIPERVEVNKVNHTQFKHFDFLISKYANDLIYKDIIKLILN